MRLLIVSQYFWPESFRITTLAEALENEGVEVTVFAAQPNYPDGVIFPGYRAVSWSREHRGTIEILRVPTVPRKRGGGFRLAANYLGFVASGLLFAPWMLRGRRFDAILVFAPSPITQAIPALWLRRFKKAIVAVWVQDLWPQSLSSTGFVRNRVALAVMGAIVRWIYRRSDLLLGQSRAFVAAIESMATTTPVAYFPNPGDELTAVELTAEPALVLPPGFNIVFTGNLGTVQALDTILDAAETLQGHADIRFVLVGSGSRLHWLREEVGRRSLKNVVLAGRFESSAIPGILAQASALLVSLSRSDILAQTIPSKIQAYLAAARPILASLDGEAAALVTSAGAGLASPAEDSVALVANIQRLHALSDAERRQMGINGRARYDSEFRPDTLARQLVATLRKLLPQTRES